jgi:hypothetical protein
MARSHLSQSAKSKIRKIRFGQKAKTVMKEFGAGTLHHGGTGKVVPKGRVDIARAIAASEQRRVNRERKHK